jgi:trehalose-6-phosphatase
MHWSKRSVRKPFAARRFDFDGTLAPIVNDPALAEVSRETVVALKA